MIDAAMIPRELVLSPHWVCWKLEVRPGESKPTKPPYNCRTGGYARHDRPSTWVTFEEALAYVAAHPQMDGIGYVFAADDPFLGIDLDACIDETGTIKPWAADIVDVLASYTELSPSGRGLHLIVEATWPTDAGHRRRIQGDADAEAKVEVFDRLRYFTITGRRWPGTPGHVAARQTRVDELARSMPAPTPASAATAPGNIPLALDDRELLDRMFGSRHGAQIQNLWAGDTSAHGGDASAADQALCNHLAFWTDNDAPRMDRLFRQSGLVRAKWESREDYRSLTIGKAIAATPEGYRPGSGLERPPMPGDPDAPPPARLEPEPEPATEESTSSSVESEPPARQVWIAVREREERERLAARIDAISRNGLGPEIVLPETATAEELLARTLPDVRWIVPEILPEGFGCLFGRTKTRKSWLALAIALAVAKGGRVLGSIPVEQRGVLYLSMEDTERRLQSRLRVLLGDSEAPATFHYRTQWPRFGSRGQGDRILREWQLLHPDVGLIILDTYAKIRAPQTPGGSAYDQDYEAAALVKTLADLLGITILVLHHQSKMAREDWVDSLNASTGLAAAADTLLLLDGKRDEASATLRITGRDVETADMHLEWNHQAAIWTLEGKAEDYERNRDRTAVYAVIARVNGPVKVPQLAQELGRSRSSVYQLVSRLVNQGDLLDLGSGFYSKPPFS